MAASCTVAHVGAIISWVAVNGFGVHVFVSLWQEKVYDIIHANVAISMLVQNV